MEIKEIDLTQYPSIMQGRRHVSRTSERYSFVSTLEAAGVLRESGWVPVKARESSSRGYQGYQKHEVCFWNSRFNRKLLVGDEVPEIVLQNSHMGSAAFVLMAGLHRCVCSNQLCVPSAIVEIRRIRHVGYAEQLVHDALEGIVEALPRTLETVEQYKAVPLNADERQAFAKAAIELRFDGDKFTVSPDDVLQKRRSSVDDGHDLWTTFNRVQENMIKGGVSARNCKGTRRKSKAVRSIDVSTKLNQRLWMLAAVVGGIKAITGGLLT